jgi:hypothetical protein
MDISSWTIAAAGECGIAFIALKVLWILTLATVKRRKDPLRRLPFLWLKWAISLFILYVKLYLPQDCARAQLKTQFYYLAFSSSALSS